MSGWDAFWAGVADVMNSGWGVPIRVLLIIIVALLVKLIAAALIRASVERIVAGVKALEAAEARKHAKGTESPVTGARRVQRTRSLGRVFGNTATAVISIVAVLLIVNTVWPQATTAFALIGAGLGAGIGLGAQGVVRDVLNGIFFAVEDQLGIGDVVDTGFATGIVEDLGVRTTQVRDVNGTLWFIPNGQISRVGNFSHGWSRAVVDLTVPYGADIEGIQAAMAQVATGLAAEAAWKDRILEPPEVWGITSISPDAVVLRAAVKTTTSGSDAVARELRARFKKAIDEGAFIPAAVTAVQIHQG